MLRRHTHAHHLAARARVIEDSRRLRARCGLSLLSATSSSNRSVAPKARRCSMVTLFPLLSGECKPMRLDNSPELLWLPRKVPMRVPENPALLLFGRGSRFGEALARHAGFVAAHGLSGR